jgi:hypothetical protein
MLQAVNQEQREKGEPIFLVDKDNGDLRDTNQTGSDTSLTLEALASTEKGMIQGLELLTKDVSYENNMVTDNYAEISLEGCNENDVWVTPDCLLHKNSDCFIVGNKMKSFLTEESPLKVGRVQEICYG